MAEALLELDLLEGIGLQDLPGSLVRDEYFAKSNFERFVTFYIGEMLFGVPADEVAEVVHPFRVTPLPNMPANLVGIAAVRGEVVAVLDLKRAIGAQAGAANVKAKLIVLNQKGSKMQMAFPVDKMHEIVLLAEKDISPTRGGTPSFVCGLANLNVGNLAIIDAEGLPDLLDN